MTHRTLQPTRPAVLLLTALALMAALLVAPADAAAPANGKGDDRRSDQARAALAKVEDLIRANGKGAAQRGVQPPKHGDADNDLTLALRDLYMARDDLSGKDRKTADRILARPTDESGPSGEPKYEGVPSRICSTVVCVHWESGSASSGYAELVRDIVTSVHAKMISFGYRPAPPDFGDESPRVRGGDSKYDIYLANIGQTMGVFGYAVPEGQPNDGSWGWGAFSYLVLDNNYTEFCSGGCSSNQATALMAATAAHEYFHAVQFGYDFAEDPWFMEGTATWIEDEIFDSINDNVNYLRLAPNVLTHPKVSLDRADANWYGNWIFFRYLSERFGRDVVRKAWIYANGNPTHGSPYDFFSTQAVKAAVHNVGGKWEKEFAKFADANRRTSRYYSEGSLYPNSKKKGNIKLKPGKRVRRAKVKLDHLASATYRVKPKGKMKKGWKLKVKIKGTKRKRGMAIAAIKKKGGKIKRKLINLGKNGKKTKKLPFGKKKVKWIEITVVNASTRFNCPAKGSSSNTDSPCDGKPKDENEKQKLRFEAIRK